MVYVGFEPGAAVDERLKVQTNPMSDADPSILFGGGGLVVSVQSFHSNIPSSNSPQSFFHFLFKKVEKGNLRRAEQKI